MKFKNLFLIAAALVFAFGVLGVSVVKTSALTKNTKIGVQVATSSGEVEGAATKATKKEIDYFLVYPGVLPDHFLYPIKMARDKVWLWLTPDPLKRAELLLLLADKRLGAGRALIEGNKIDLGVATITKAEKYLEQAISQEKIAREKNKDTHAFLQKLSLADQKHEEVLLKIKEKVPDSTKVVIDSALDYTRKGYEQVKQELGK